MTPIAKPRVTPLNLSPSSDSPAGCEFQSSFQHASSLPPKNGTMEKTETSEKFYLALWNQVVNLWKTPSAGMRRCGVRVGAVREPPLRWCDRLQTEYVTVIVNEGN